MNTEMNEKIALAMGWFKREGGILLNSHGAPVSGIPDFSGDQDEVLAVIRHFETLEQRIRGNKQAFFARYNSQLSALEVCELALEILGER